MMWSWPGMPNTWGYALTTVGMMLFWILVIFGAIVVAQRLGRMNPPAVERSPLIRCSPGRSPVAKPTRPDVGSISALRNDRAESDPCGRTTTHPPSDAPLPPAQPPAADGAMRSLSPPNEEPGEPDGGSAGHDAIPGSSASRRSTWASRSARGRLCRMSAIWSASWCSITMVCTGTSASSGSSKS